MEKNDNKVGTNFSPDKISVVTSGGQHILYMPSGENIKYPVWTRVMDEAGEQPYVIAKILCNLLEQKDIPDKADLIGDFTELERQVKYKDRIIKDLQDKFNVNTALIRYYESEIGRLNKRKWYHLLFGI